MRDFISDFNSMKVIPNSIPKNAIPTPIPIQMMAIPIPPGLGKANSNSIPIPELDLELARKSNSGAELTPTLYPNHDCSALMKWPNSNQFANCSHTTHSVHIESG